MNEIAASGYAILDDAHRMLIQTVAGVRPDQLGLPTPCDQWNVTQVIQHASWDQLGYARAITGDTGPAEDPFAPSGVLAEEPLELAGRLARAAADAWRTVDQSAPSAPTPLPQGNLPVRIAVGAGALDAAVHAWDIAVATSQGSPLSAEMARELLYVAREIVEPLRGYGVYAAALEPLTDDDDVAALLRYLGRRPDWAHS
jgi:uncharacterized protein (TIGR03086 family)